MFGALIRAAGVLVAGSLLAYALMLGGGEFVDTHEQEAFTESQDDRVENWQWGQRIITWWPAIVVATIVAILIGSAITRRRQTRI